MSEQNPTPEKPRKRRKDDMMRTRIDPELHEAAKKKAQDYGWSFGSVVRALLRLWVQEDVISAKDVGNESERAPKTRKKRQTKK